MMFKTVVVVLLVALVFAVVWHGRTIEPPPPVEVDVTAQSSIRRAAPVNQDFQEQMDRLRWQQADDMTRLRYEQEQSANAIYGQMQEQRWQDLRDQNMNDLMSRPQCPGLIQLC